MSKINKREGGNLKGWIAQRRSVSHPEAGFTMVEMMVTLTIVIILTLVAIIGFNAQRQAAVDSSVETDVRSAVTKIERWQAMNPGASTVPEDIIAGDSTSETDTVITLVPQSDGEYELRGFNPRGGETSESLGYVYDSVKDAL